MTASIYEMWPVRPTTVRRDVAAGDAVEGAISEE